MKNYKAFIDFLYDNLKDGKAISLVDFMHRYEVPLSTSQRLVEMGWLSKERIGIVWAYKWLEVKPTDMMAEELRIEVTGEGRVNFATMKHF